MKYKHQINVCYLRIRARSTSETLHQYCREFEFDFDHQKPNLKIAEISNMGSLSSKVAKEIKKCLLLCANCHRLKSNHWSRLTTREQEVFTALAEDHSLNINPPYDEKSFFKDDRAFLQYKLCIAFNMRSDVRGGILIGVALIPPSPKCRSKHFCISFATLDGREPTGNQEFLIYFLLAWERPQEPVLSL